MIEIDELIAQYCAEDQRIAATRHKVGQEYYQIVLPQLPDWMQPYLRPEDGDWPVLELPELAPISVAIINNTVQYSNFLVYWDDQSPTYRSDHFRTDDLGYVLKNARDELERYQRFARDAEEQKAKRATTDQIYNSMLDALRNNSAEWTSTYALALIAHLKYIDPDRTF